MVRRISDFGGCHGSLAGVFGRPTKLEEIDVFRRLLWVGWRRMLEPDKERRMADSVDSVGRRPAGC